MMKSPLIAFVAIAFAYSMQGAPAQAQTRVFVGATGSDANPCTFASPCRSFQHAHDTAPANGEIDVLDPAGYGAVTITKAISIQGHGYAGISVANGATGITITAGSSDAIALNGLLIDGSGVGQNGIIFNSGGNLTVEHCLLRNFTTYGIGFVPNASSNLAVSDTLVTNVASFLGVGIIVQPTGSGTVTATFNRVETDNNFDGIGVSSFSSSGVVNGTATDSVAAGNSNIGFYSYGNGSSGAASLMLAHSVAANNHTGIEVDYPSASLWIGQSTVTGNANGWVSNAGGVLQSYGTNQITGNASNEAAPPLVAGGLK